MAAAGQLDYLVESEIVGDEWRVLVEIHYYRDRPRTMANLNKDTLGQTLFVNLNDANKTPDTGPEFLVNPPLVDTRAVRTPTGGS